MSNAFQTFLLMQNDSSQLERVSVIIPCRNEEQFIGKVLDNILQQDYAQDLLEIFVVDGNSEDGTPELVRSYARKHNHIQLLSNPKKVVPYALNLAIRMSTGNVVVRMDAHSEYPDNYISALVEGLNTYKCDNTGGVWITEPANEGLKARAIADATSHPFGIGNAHYRLNIKEPRRVDTVPFGCYKREVFERIGLFDEELVRNQDDEFNARLIREGGSIYLLPEVKIRYFARENFSKTARMFYQYGLYKPLVNLKVGKPATARQFVPPLFVMYVLCSMLLGLFNPFYFALLGGILGFYLVVDLLVSLQLLLSKSRPIFLLFHLLIAFPLIHFSYGFGYLSGIIRFMLFRRPIHHSKIQINR